MRHNLFDLADISAERLLRASFFTVILGVCATASLANVSPASPCAGGDFNGYVSSKNFTKKGWCLPTNTVVRVSTYPQPNSTTLACTPEFSLSEPPRYYLSLESSMTGGSSYRNQAGDESCSVSKQVDVGMMWTYDTNGNKHASRPTRCIINGSFDRTNEGDVIQPFCWNSVGMSLPNPTNWIMKGVWGAYENFNYPVDASWYPNTSIQENLYLYITYKELHEYQYLEYPKVYYVTDGWQALQIGTNYNPADFDEDIYGYCLLIPSVGIGELKVTSLSVTEGRYQRTIKTDESSPQNLWQTVALKFSDEYTTQRLVEDARNTYVPESVASGSEIWAAYSLSANEDHVQIARGDYWIEVNTSAFESGKRYQTSWFERFVSKDGTKTNDYPMPPFQFIADGGVVRSESYVLDAPKEQGTVFPMMKSPDFLISGIEFENPFLPPGSSAHVSDMWVRASISSMENTSKETEYLSRIRWAIHPIPGGNTLGITAKGRGLTKDGTQAEGRVAAGSEVGRVYVVAYDVDNPGVIYSEILDISCSSCGDGGCGTGAGSVENASVELSLNLGNASDGSALGNLIVHEPLPNSYTYTPYSLSYSAVQIAGGEVLKNQEGMLRQIYSSGGLIDITIPDELKLTISRITTENKPIITYDYIDGTQYINRADPGSIVTTNNVVIYDAWAGYEIAFYQPEQVGVFSNGVYDVSGETPFKIWRVEDPDRLENNYRNVKISEITISESSSKTNVNQFVWDGDSNGWELSRGGQITSRSRYGIYENVVVKSEDGTVASQTLSTFESYLFGEAIVKEVQDPDGDALTTYYTYYLDESDKERLGKLESVKYPDGSWMKYFYDDEGRSESVWSPWLDVTLEQATDSNCKRTDTGYEPIDPTDLAQDDEWVNLRPRLVTEYIEGTPVSKTVYAYYTNATERIEKTVEYADPVAGGYADSANQVSTSIYYRENDANPDAADKIKAFVSAEGMTAGYGYARGDFVFDSSLYSNGTYAFTPDTNGAWLCETVTNGIVASPAGIANKTTMSVSYRNGRGGVVLSETWVCTGGTSYARIDWSANEYDYDLPEYQSVAVGHVINRYSSDGSYEESTWSSCCGLERTIDRQGQIEIYNNTALGRRDHITRVGEGSQPDVNVVYTFDAAGRQVSMTETGGGMSRTTGSSYDLAGRMRASTNEAGLVTHYDYANGGRISTVTMPGGATQITETYIDGRTKHVHGTGTVERTYEYGVNAVDGTQWTKAYTGSQGINSPRWEKTVADRDGKTLRTEQPGFGGVLLSTVYHYDASGRLWKKERMEGSSVESVSLNEYDAIGNVVRSGLDVDKNDHLDLASMDRISDSDSSYWNDGTDWFRKSWSVTYPRDNNALAVTNSIGKTRLTGLGVSGTHGILTGENIGADPFGNETVSRSWLNRAGKTVTQIGHVPTSSEDQVSVSINGQRKSVSSLSSGVVQYGYDGLGRQTTVLDPRIGTSTTHYNAKGQVAWTEDTHGVGTGYGYAPETGQQISTSTTNGAEVATTYVEFDARSNLVRQWGSATYPVSYDYDDFGQKTRMHTYRGGKDWDGESWPGDTALADTTQWIYDPATGLLTDKRYADGKGPSYAYWPDGKLKTRTWARKVNGQPLTTTYSYYDTGELQTTDYSDSTPDISYAYYRNGQQKTITDAQGIRTFAYTDEGSLESETIVAGASSSVIIRSYDSFGRPDGYSTAGVLPAPSVDYGYDSYGRFATITSSVDSVTSVVEYSYLQNSGMISGHTARIAGGSPVLTVTKGYEADRNLIVGVTNTAASGIVSAFTYTNDDLGRRTRREDQRSMDLRPVHSYWDYGYNSRSELTNAVRRLPNAEPVAGQSKSYLYDNIGNRRFVGRDGSPQPSANLEIYSANNLNQYIARTVPSYVDVMGTATNIATVTVREVGRDGSPQQSALPAPVIRQDDYFYKAYPVDNLTGLFCVDLEINAVINPPGTNDPDIVRTETRSSFVPQTPEQFNYDDDGNLKSDGRFIYAWNGENRLIEVQSRTGILPVIHVTYTYDYQGRRFEKMVGAETTTFLWNGNRIIREEFSTKTNTYTWGLPDHLVCASLQTANAQPQTVFCAHDSNKNVTDLVDANGAVVAQYDYDAYGNRLVSEGAWADANPFLFSNEYHDSETGLIAYKYRSYNPVTGRWLNRDPMGEAMGDNLYAFVDNNAVNHIDNLGLWKATQESKGKARRVHRQSLDDNMEGLAKIVGLEYSEISKWAKEVKGKDGKVIPCEYSVPNVWISADLLRGGSWYYQQLIVSIGGTVGRFIGTDVFTWGYKIEKPDSIRELTQSIWSNKGDIWGMVVFGHGNPEYVNDSKQTINAGNELMESNTSNWILQRELRYGISLSGYKLSKIYMMQCFSAAGNHRSAWESLTVTDGFFGYEGTNLLMIDFGYLNPKNWF